MRVPNLMPGQKVRLTQEVIDSDFVLTRKPKVHVGTEAVIETINDHSDYVQIKVTTYRTRKSRPIDEEIWVNCTIEQAREMRRSYLMENGLIRSYLG